MERQRTDYQRVDSFRLLKTARNGRFFDATMMHMPKKKQTQNEPDSEYFLKLVLYVVLGSLWLKFSSPLTIGVFEFNGLPVGFVLGLMFASHDHFQVDRKIEYALLIIVAILTYFVPAGIVI